MRITWCEPLILQVGIGVFYVLNACISPNSYGEILTPKMMELGRGFGKSEGQEDGALMNKLSVLTEEAAESSLAPSTL